MNSRYPKPKEVGGHLIRRLVAFLREMEVQLPLTSHILIAISGGIDSVALAHLISHFGRRIVDKKQITFLHINHGWRGEESDQDELFIRDLSHQWKIPLIVHQLHQKEELLKKPKYYSIGLKGNSFHVYLL